MIGALRRLVGATFRELPRSGDRASVGGLVYAVGDIHGCADLLERLCDIMAADARESAADGPPTVVFLGDLVDRGPNSARVIDLIIELPSRTGWRVHTLKGNHEQAMLQFLDDPAFGPTWVAHGGGPTLASYGVFPALGQADEAAWTATRDAFAEALPPGHLRFLQSLDLYIELGDYLFVHAGVRPGVPISLQSEQDLLWIRGDFLSRARACERVVVHGHTPTEAPELSRWRIGVDTGAYATGVLTAIRLSGDAQSMLQARRGR